MHRGIAQLLTLTLSPVLKVMLENGDLLGEHFDIDIDLCERRAAASAAFSAIMMT